MKRRIIWGGAIAICLCTAVAGWGWHRLSQRRSLPFPLSDEPVVGRRLYSLGSSSGPPPPDSAPRLHDWPVMGDSVPVPPDIAAALREVLSSPSTYTIYDSQCFEPGLAVSFGAGSNRVDVLICLLCNRAMFYRGDMQVGRCLSDEGKRRLSSIYDRLFQ